ncbi:MAG: DUF333 domain-containing protein [Myxococcota bacterium]
MSRLLLLAFVVVFSACPDLGPPNACEAQQGSCVALVAGACSGGRLADGDLCGGGVGVACCLPQPEADSGVEEDACASAGGTCVAVAPGGCPGGRAGPADACGGVGVMCCLPPAPVDGGADACREAGGACVAATPGSCASGRYGPANSCGGLGSACCLDATADGGQVPNPAQDYCTRLGYAVEAVSSPVGESSDCVFPTGDRCEAFAFFRGECGAAWTKCAQHGGTVSAESFDGGTWTGAVSRCTLPSGATCDEVDFARTGSCP